MTHYADKAYQDEWVGKKFETFEYAYVVAVGFFFGNWCSTEESDREAAYDCKYHEKESPTKPESRQHCQCGPRCDNWGEKRGNCFHELPEGESRCESVAAYKVRDERIERCLHNGISYSKKGECYQHYAVAVAEDRDYEGNQCNDKANQNGFFSSDFVHQHSGGH